MLTTDLDDPGYGWNRSLPTTGASRSIRQLWSALDGRNLAMDQMLPEASACPVWCSIGRQPRVLFPDWRLSVPRSHTVPPKYRCCQYDLQPAKRISSIVQQHLLTNSN